MRSLSFALALTLAGATPLASQLPRVSQDRFAMSTSPLVNAPLVSDSAVRHAVRLDRDGPRLAQLSPPSHTIRKAALVGAAVGLAVGVTTASLMNIGCKTCDDPSARVTRVIVAYGVGGAVVGGALGAGVGVLRSRH